MKKFRYLAAMLLAATLSFQATADETSVKQALEQKLNTRVEKVTKTKYLGLYEAYLSGQILYTDEGLTTIIAGSIIDPATMANVTAERMRTLNVVKVQDLPLDLAVKMVRGDGSRTLITFEDPNCGYCKRIANDLAKLDNVTIYTFLYPILSPDSREKSKKVWCSSDRPKAWTSLMLKGTQPANKGECDAPIEKVLSLGNKLSITGTPTLVFADGQRVPGAISAAEIETHLERATKLR